MDTSNTASPVGAGAVPLPKWIGRFPFPPEEKRFTIIHRHDEISGFYGFEGHAVLVRRFLSLDQFSISEWTLTQGNFYEPAGLHNFGDELYYFVEGDPVAFAPATGETYQLHAGDALYIPQGTRHQIFGFNGKQIVAISIVAPRVWAIEDNMGTMIPPVAAPRFYRGGEVLPQEAASPAAQREEMSEARGRPSIDSLGCWPLEGKAARAARKIVPVRAGDQLPLIHGKAKHVLVSFIVSNDYMHVALLQIPVGGMSESETHESDEFVYALEGDLVMQVEEPGADPRNAAGTCHKLFQGEKCFLPARIPHKYFNYTTQPVRAMLILGPRL